MDCLRGRQRRGSASRRASDAQPRLREAALARPPARSPAVDRLIIRGRDGRIQTKRATAPILRTRKTEAIAVARQLAKAAPMPRTSTLQAPSRIGFTSTVILAVRDLMGVDRER